MLIFDVLVIGGGVSGMSCALMLGSAQNQIYAKHKKIGIITHQRSSSLQNAVFNNVLGVIPKTAGASILESGKKQLTELYPHVVQIENEKVFGIQSSTDSITVSTNKNTYSARKIVIAVGPKNFSIKGLEDFMEPHSKIDPEKNRTQLKNENHVVTNGIYVSGVLAGLRSQFAIASGSGASIAMDILCEWNDGNPVKVHDKV